MTLRKLSFVLVFCCLCISAVAQNVYTPGQVDHRPYFRGGDRAMYEWIFDNMNYPDALLKAGKGAKVVVNIVVGSDGRIVESKLPRRGNPEFDREAIRLVRSMPYWEPGVRVNQYVPVRMEIMVEFNPSIYYGRHPERRPKPVERVKQVPVNKTIGIDTAPRQAETTKSEEPEKVYNVAMVEVKPSFPGGDGAMYSWLAQHINYPAAAAEEGVQGRVTVQFVVEKDGSITNVKVIRGRNPELDKEAVRVVKAMPKWTPAQNNGKVVSCNYSMPVTFKLN